MKYIKQLFLILILSFIGEILKALIPLPVPASIYGLVLLFTALCTGIIKLDQVKESGNFLVAVMPIMFIPPAVGLMNAWDQLKEFLVPLLIITFVSTVVVMAVSGIVTQKIMERKEKH